LWPRNEGTRFPVRGTREGAREPGEAGESCPLPLGRGEGTVNKEIYNINTRFKFNVYITILGYK